MVCRNVVTADAISHMQIAYHLNQQLLCLVVAEPKMQLACPPCGVPLPEVEQACTPVRDRQLATLIYIKGTLSRCTCLPHPRKTWKKSWFSLTSNQIELASTLEHTIVRYQDIVIVSANECPYLWGPVCLHGGRCLKPVLCQLCNPELNSDLN